MRGYYGKNRPSAPVIVGAELGAPSAHDGFRVGAIVVLSAIAAATAAKVLSPRLGRR